MKPNDQYYSRRELLKEVEGLPGTALVSARHAAAVLDSSPSVLANWRSQRRGPPYCGNGAFIRYRLADLQSWIDARAAEVQRDLEVEAVDRCGAAR